MGKDYTSPFPRVAHAQLSPRRALPTLPALQMRGAARSEVERQLGGLEAWASASS